MSEEILINVTPQETRVAVMEQGAAQEIHIERTSSHGLVGNVYLGRVCRVLPGMQSAFVEIGLGARGVSCTSPTSGRTSLPPRTAPSRKSFTKGRPCWCR